MVDKKRSTSLKVQRGGRYLEFKHSSSTAKRKLACGLASPSSAVSYNGVRMRVWGKWVTEVRDPVTKSRIWLGSFATAEMAARAYDAAVVCLKGASAPEVNFPDSIPSFVIPQSNSSPKEIQAVALAAAKASVPAAAPLAMAATPELPNPPREAIPEVPTDRELYRDGDANYHGTSSCEVSEPERSWSSSVENWIFNDFEEGGALDTQDALLEPLQRQISDSVEQLFRSLPLLSVDTQDALLEPLQRQISDSVEQLFRSLPLVSVDTQDALLEPLQRQISDSVEQLFRPWPLLSEDFEDGADCWTIHRDVQPWSFT